MSDKATRVLENDDRLVRVDAAHRIHSSPEIAVQDDSPELFQSAAALSEDAAENTRLHAFQLARHLQDRRREVDRREAHLNARIALLENEVRLSRLWLQERTEEFARRESELANQVAEQESRIRGLTATELTWDTRHENKSRELADREEGLAQRDKLAVDTLRQLDERQAALLTRARQLDEQEKLMDEQWTQLNAQRQESERERAELNEEMTRVRRQEAEHQRRLAAQESHQKRTWEARQQQFDRRQIALEKVRQEIIRLHREALEMRLVAEQLWSQLTTRVHPRELTKGVSQLREQLADEFRFVQQDITDQRATLEGLIAKLDAQRDEIAAQRNELTAWVGRRQQELTTEADRLSEHESAFARERKQHSLEEQRWQTERFDLQRQIRRLTLQVRQSQRAAA
jgi:hypothetical protein